MCRSTASILLLLSVAASFAPATVARVTIPMPACCRAAGPHHCSAVAQGGVKVRAQSCPYRKPLLFSGSAAPPPASESVAPTEAHPFLHEFYPHPFVFQSEKPHPERAPPQPSLN